MHWPRLFSEKWKALDFPLRKSAATSLESGKTTREEKLSERKGIVDLLDRNAVSRDATIITEPTNLVIGLGHKGTCITTIELHGVSAHSSVPQLGVNAIEKAAKFILALHEMPTME